MQYNTYIMSVGWPTLRACRALSLSGDDMATFCIGPAVALIRFMSAALIDQQIVAFAADRGQNPLQSIPLDEIEVEQAPDVFGSQRIVTAKPDLIQARYLHACARNWGPFPATRSL